MSKARNQASQAKRSGFTVIEVMLFLAVTGMLLLGVLGGTYASISAQRYNDSVRSFAEFLRQSISEVISPESIGAITSPDNYIGGNSDDYAIYGKVLSFGADEGRTVYTATLVGSPDIPTGDMTFTQELSKVGAKMFCGDDTHESSVMSYTMPWQSQIMHNVTTGGEFRGTIIIARSPSSGTIHTVYNDALDLDLENGCRPDVSGHNSPNYWLKEALAGNFKYSYGMSMPVTVPFEPNNLLFCIKSDLSNIVRGVMLLADARNTTSVHILNDEDARKSWADSGIGGCY